MKEVMFIYCMQRAGQHAIINWLIPQYKGKVIHTNCCRINRDELTVEQIHNHDVKEYGKGENELHLYNFENFNLDNLDGVDINDLNVTQNVDKITEVSIVRDPYNWFASCIKQKERDYQPQEQYYSYIVTQYLKFIDLIDADRFTISYNKWFTDLSYRQEISEKLGLQFSDKGINKVSSYGGGSSFDRKNFDGNASSMKVLERYKQLNKKEMEIFNKFKDRFPRHSYWWNYDS